MKKLVSMFVLLGLTAPAVAAPSYLTRTGDGGYRVTYDYTDKAKTGWYVGGRAELGFWNWENKYSVDDDLTGLRDAFKNDDYSFEPVFGGSLSAGRRFAYFWRAELELGYLGHFDDSDADSSMSLQIPYVMLNGYYDFANGLYLGAGVGAAMPITEMELRSTIPVLKTFDSSDRTEYSFAPMAGLMLGYSYELDNNLVLDLRYRFAIMTGFDHRVGFDDWNDTAHWIQNDVDFLMDNSISIGIRYEF